ncbi:unnamed protein product [Prorocentrum cordatum]|uniref:Uncharacterized protein n=1 Tax=Prorocentrum cordatum TaxID=2364126 RepID=A0ABN9TQR5_9DINO|nr:unnamed protein product [Polarella glacialis]
MPLQGYKDVLQNVGKSGRDLMAWHFQQGLYSISCYSGTGFIEMTLCAIGASLETDFGYDLGRGVKNVEACDVLPLCRSVLIGFRGGSGFDHVFGDFNDRVRADVRAQLHDITRPSKHDISASNPGELVRDVRAKINRMFDLLGADAFEGASSRCYKHDRHCFVHDVPPRVIDGEVAGAWAGMRVASAGATCLDYTPWGDQCGLAGPRAKTLITYLAERKAKKEALMVLECVFSEVLVSLLLAVLGDEYDVDYVELGPDDLGHPHMRSRMWVVGYRRASLIRTGSLAEMKECFARRVVGDADDYFVASDEEINQDLARIARQRHVDALPPWLIGHLAGYREEHWRRVVMGELGVGEPRVVDLSQDPVESPRQARVLQTLTRSGMRYSILKKRPMLGKERYGSMGVPVKSLVGAFGGPASSRPCWACPFEHIFEQLSDTHCCLLTGNGMHMLPRLKCGSICRRTALHSGPWITMVSKADERYVVDDGELPEADVGESEHGGDGLAAAPPPPEPHLQMMATRGQRILKDPKGMDLASGADPERQAIFSLPAKAANMCKLCCSAPKAGKHTYCKKCRQKVEAAKRAICVDEESTTYFSELEKMADPTKLRIVIFDCEKQLNPDGQATRGNPRTGEFDIMGYKEVWETSTVVDEGQKRVPMTHFRFIKHFTEEEGYTPTEAQRFWEECEAADCPRDWKGRNGEVRLKVAVEDFELVFNRKRKGNELSGSLKEKKKPKVIGASTAQARWTGQRDMSRGAEKKGARRAATSASAGSSALSDADGDGPAVKKAKFDAESKRNQFRSSCRDQTKGIRANLEETLCSAEKAWGAFSSEELASDDYREYHFTLAGRVLALRVVLGSGLKAAMGKYYAPSHCTEGADAAFDAALAGDSVAVQTLCDWLKSKGLAMPCAGFAETLTVARLCVDAANAGAEVSSAEELKAAVALWKEKVQRLLELTQATKTAEKDLVARKASAEKRKAQKATQAAKQAAQERAKFEKEEKKKAEKAAQEARKRAAQQPAAALAPKAAWTILTCDLKHHVEISKTSAVEFKQSEVDCQLPHVVSNVDTAFFTDCKEAVAVTSAWKMGFPTSEPVKAKGKSTWGLPQAEALRTGLSNFGPPSESCCEDLATTSYTSALRSVSVFGYSVSLRNSGTETHSLGSLRLQLAGRRLVIAARVEDVVGFVQEEAEPVIRKPTSTDLSNIFKYADQKIVDALRGRGARLFHTIVEPSSVLYMPVGFWVIEKPIGLEDNFGIRCSCLPRVAPQSAAAESFRALCNVIANGVPDPRQVKYVTTVFEAMTGQPVDTQAAPGSAPVKAEERERAQGDGAEHEHAQGDGAKLKEEAVSVYPGSDANAEPTMAAGSSGVAAKASVANKWGKYGGKKKSPQAESAQEETGGQPMVHYNAVAAPAQGLDTSWPEDLGLTLPPGRSRVRGRRSTKEQGLRTPSSVGTPVFSDTGSSGVQTAGESAETATEVPSLGASGATAAVAGSGDSGETSSAKSELEEPVRAARKLDDQQAAALAP